MLFGERVTIIPQRFGCSGYNRPMALELRTLRYRRRHCPTGGESERRASNPGRCGTQYWLGSSSVRTWSGLYWARENEPGDYEMAEESGILAWYWQRRAESLRAP
jgi:hypothetical protein